MSNTKTKADNLESIIDKVDKNEAKEKQIKNFADILDNIASLEDKKKMLWKEIYENALEDREKAKMLFNDAYISMQGGINEHMNIGAVMSKYLERMCRSNDQILKLAELISKEEEKADIIDDDDIFSRINK
jgi:N-acetylglucosamine kinase-like BadF-type ATPase